MPITVTGLIETERMLAEVETTAKSRAVMKLYEKAQQIASRARKYAPLDKGNLEKAIKVFPATPPVSRIRNSKGQFVRQDIFVYVDTTMSISGRPGKTIGDYAYTMHEHLTPYGGYKLGELSQAKQSGQSEMVGGKYLERAMSEIGQTVLSEVSQSILLSIRK